MFQKLFGAKSDSLAQAHAYQQMPFLLVSGFGRSGTTVLRKCFAAHSQIHANENESNVIQNIAGMAWRSHENKNQRDNLVVSQDTYWRLFQNLILQMHWPEPTSSGDVKAISTGSAMTIMSLSGMQAAFPNCVFCYVVRNGIEVVSSHINFPPFKRLGFEHACREWQKHSLVAAFGETLGNFKLFRHEWLLDRATAVAKLNGVLSSLGLSLEQSCEEVVFGESFHPTSFVGETAQESKELAKRGERWRLWTDEQRKIFEAECREAMEQFGYEIPWR